MTSSHFIETDQRGRVTLGRPNARFRMTEESDGTLVLEPAVIVTELERRYLANAALQAQIEHARTHPEQQVSRKRRTSGG